MLLDEDSVERDQAGILLRTRADSPAKGNRPLRVSLATNAGHQHNTRKSKFN